MSNGIPTKVMRSATLSDVCSLGHLVSHCGGRWGRAALLRHSHDERVGWHDGELLLASSQCADRHMGDDRDGTWGAGRIRVTVSLHRSLQQDDLTRARWSDLKLGIPSCER